MNPESDDLRHSELIGLGKASIRKNYYPELKRTMHELQRFRELLDLSSDGIFLLSYPDFSIADGNQAAREIMESAAFRDGFQQSFLGVFSEDDAEKLKCFCDTGGDTATYTLVADLPRKHGEGFHVELRIKKAVFQEESFIVVTARDITQQQRLTRQLRRSLHEKDVLLREVHHRVGNNFQLITSLLSLELDFQNQRTVNLDPGQLKFIQNAIDRVQSMAFIHADLYRTEHFDRIAMMPLSNALLHRVVSNRMKKTEDICIHISGASIELEMNLAVPLSLILNELASNSIEHVYETRGNLCISLDWQQSGDQVVMTYRDDGPGIPSYIDPMQPETLGLTLIQSLAAQAGAEMETWQSRGSVFRFSFSIQTA